MAFLRERAARRNQERNFMQSYNENMFKSSRTGVPAPNVSSAYSPGPFNPYAVPVGAAPAPAPYAVPPAVSPYGVPPARSPFPYGMPPAMNPYGVPPAMSPFPYGYGAPPAMSPYPFPQQFAPSMMPFPSYAPPMAPPQYPAPVTVAAPTVVHTSPMAASGPVRFSSYEAAYDHAMAGRKSTADHHQVVTRPVTAYESHGETVAYHQPGTVVRQVVPSMARGPAYQSLPEARFSSLDAAMDYAMGGHQSAQSVVRPRYNDAPYGGYPGSTYVNDLPRGHHGNHDDEILNVEYRRVAGDGGHTYLH